MAVFHQSKYKNAQIGGELSHMGVCNLPISEAATSDNLDEGIFIFGMGEAASENIPHRGTLSVL